MRSLEQFRRFFLQVEETVPQTAKPQTLSTISATLHNSQTPYAKSVEPSEMQQMPFVKSPKPSLISAPPRLTKLAERFQLGGSNYLTPLTLDSADARRFFEIEAADNAWSVRELKRQLYSSLYEQLALSRDKHEVHPLAREGQVIEKASVLIKDSVVLGFVALDKKLVYSQSDLETPIIDRLQQLLLELGKRFL